MMIGSERTQIALPVADCQAETIWQDKHIKAAFSLGPRFSLYMWLRPVIFWAIEFCQITMFVMDSQDFASKHKSFVPGPTYVPPPWPSPQKGLDHKIDSNWLSD